VTWDVHTHALIQAKQVEKEAGLSQEALENMGWPYEELQALEQIVQSEREMRNILRAHRLMGDDAEDSHKLRANIQHALQVAFVSVSVLSAPGCWHRIYCARFHLSLLWV
jgi:hypothetical protein